MRRQLVSIDEAIPAVRQHAKPCSDCPLARTSLKGWLGGGLPEEWAKDLHQDVEMECHTLLGAQCAGVAIYRANVGKLPRELGILRLPQDKVRVFSSPMEFLKHHGDRGVPARNTPSGVVDGASVPDRTESGSNRHTQESEKMSKEQVAELKAKHTAAVTKLKEAAAAQKAKAAATAQGLKDQIAALKNQIAGLKQKKA